MTDDEVLADVVIDVGKWKSDARAFALKQWDDDRIDLARLKRELALQSDDAPMIGKIGAKVEALQNRVDAGSELYFGELVSAKVARHRAVAETRAAQPDYKNRAERQAEADEKQRVENAARLASAAEAQARRAKALDDLVAAKVQEILSAKGVVL